MWSCGKQITQGEGMSPEINPPLFDGMGLTEEDALWLRSHDPHYLEIIGIALRESITYQHASEMLRRQLHGIPIESAQRPSTQPFHWHNKTPSFGGDRALMKKLRND